MKISQNRIRTIAVSVQGSLHRHKKIPCQDYFAYSAKGKNYVAVVSDGAGSAKYGKIGARIVCDTLVDLLKNIPFHAAESKIKKAICVARQKLARHRLNKNNINDFAATVVGAIYHNKKGLFFHIGDGAAIALHDKSGNMFSASRPENGIYACETYFYTQEDWLQNLRVINFSNANSLFLMSDGLTSFSFSSDFSKLEKGFVLPINNFLTEEKSKMKARKALENTLNASKAQNLNSDDKTLVWTYIGDA